MERATQRYQLVKRLNDAVQGWGFEGCRSAAVRTKSVQTVEPGNVKCTNSNMLLWSSREKSEQRELSIQFALPGLDARVGTGIDDVVECLFADGIHRPDVAAQDFAVRQSATCVFFVYTQHFRHSMRIAHSDDVTSLFHNLKVDVNFVS